MKMLFAATAALMAVAAPVHAASVDFEEFASGPQGSSLTSGIATITSPGTLYILSYGGSQALCPTPGDGTCSSDITLSFAAPVVNLGFYIDGVDDVGSSLSYVLSFSGGGTASGSFSAFNPSGRSYISFGTPLDITGLTLSSNDPYGLVYDDFIFDLAGPTGPVPEPASWALMIAGFGIAGGALRRHRGLIALA